jgi:cytochrome P450
MDTAAASGKAKNSDIVEALSNFDKAAIRRYQKRNPSPTVDHMPGGNGMPVAGHMYWALKDFHGWLNQQYAEHGPVFKFCTPIGDSVVLLGPEADQLNRAFTDLLGGGRDLLRKKEIWFSPFAKALKGRAVLEQFVFKNIPERRREETRDIFSQLCHAHNEEGNVFSDDEIRDHIIFVLFAAQDTTTSVLGAALYSLASNEGWQEELRQEMMGLNKELLEFEDIEHLEKTSWTFKEALRMQSPLPAMPRYALKEFECNGQRIPANTNVMVSALFTHNMPEYWSNPAKFDPHRFCPDRAEDKKDFFQYIPFGGGAHKCLGLHFAETQGKMFLFHLLKNYRVTKNPKLTRFKTIAFPLNHSTDGLPLTLTKI